MRKLLMVVVVASLGGCAPTATFDPSATSGPGWRQLPSAVWRGGGSFLETTSLWAGDRLVVIHGADGQSETMVGEVYDLERGVVRATTSPVPWGSFEAVWTGREVLVWGGNANVREVHTDAAAYDPTRDRWRRLARSPSRYGGGTAAWTGRKLLVFDTDSAVYAYDPDSDRWRPGRRAPLAGRRAAATVWTGRELLVWGGCPADDGDCLTPLGDGAAYDPATHRWRPLPPAPIEGLGGAGNVWTGAELIVWGGISRNAPAGSATGAAYDPVNDRWRTLPAAPMSGRSEHMMVWTGREVLVWDGTTIATEGGLAGDGGRYDPVADRWTPMPPVPPGVMGPGLRRAGAGTWTPFGLVVTGGYPAADTWLLSPSS